MPEFPYYDCLRKTVSLLIVDDDPEQLDFYNEILSGHPLLKVTKASTSRQAKNILCTLMPHICILDLGIDDVENDEFYLLRKYSRKLPFIIMSASVDIERAFTATKIGAAGMIAKPPDINSSEFWYTIGSLFLEQTILPTFTDTMNPCLGECCHILHNEAPQSVSDWAKKAGITDTYLRKLWTDCFACSPKHFLFMYKYYKDAIYYFNGRYLAELNEQEPAAFSREVAELQRQENYFLRNKNVLEAIRDKNIRPKPAQQIISSLEFQFQD
jgi:CheY-like chemotaxis protein